MDEYVQGAWGREVQGPEQVEVGPAGGMDVGKVGAGASAVVLKTPAFLLNHCTGLF